MGTAQPLALRRRIVRSHKDWPLRRTGDWTMIKLTINGQAQEVDVAGDTPILWVLRDTLGMTGTKYGCGKAICGSCTVHVDGVPTRSCVTPVESVAGKSITTIEGLSSNRSTRCSWRGSKWTCPSAGTVSPVRSWRRQRC